MKNELNELKLRYKKYAENCKITKQRPYDFDEWRRLYVGH